MLEKRRVTDEQVQEKKTSVSQEMKAEINVI